MAKKEIKNYEYVLDIRTPFIKKLYDKENNYKVEFLTLYETLEELKKLQKENADLEAKLAEHNDTCQHYEYQLTELNKEIYRLQQRERFLEQQLAEKQKEIEKLKELNLDIPIKQMQFHHNQDKISFCVEKLEKVRELCIKDMTICEDYFAIEKILDNQIKQLKEGK